MHQTQISFRCFQPEDLPEILRIQDENLRGNLTPADQADGYLSVAFAAQQFRDMHREIPVIVADLGPRLGGYLCSSSLTYSRQVPLLSHMIGLFKETSFNSKMLDAYRTFVYGPVCIDKPLRGRGLLNGLFKTLANQLAGRFEVGTLFISLNNPRSLRAHTHHLGMQHLRTFTFKSAEYILLAFEVPSV